MSFKSLGLSPSLLETLGNLKFPKPYPIQVQAIPSILQNKDILAIAQTGSGKTASYVLPVIHNLQADTSIENRHVHTLVLVPTRELAVQVVNVFQQFTEPLAQRIKAIAVFGGVSINPQMKDLQGVHILVATPGRLIELLESNAVHLSQVQTLVLDEADKMLSMGFQAEMDKILERLPQKRQNLLFSATLSKDVDLITQLVLNNPVVIEIDKQEDTFDLIRQSAYFIEEDKKGPLLRYLIKEKNMQQVLVFTSSVYQADNVADKLRNNGIQAVAIHSKKRQGARTEALQKFKLGKLQVLVTTDLLARGIDIEFLPCVINYELPRSPKDYVHRIGRTGRAESPGEAITFVSEADQHHFKIIQKKMKKWVERVNIDSINLHGY